MGQVEAIPLVERPTLEEYRQQWAGLSADETQEYSMERRGRRENGKRERERERESERERQRETERERERKRERERRLLIVCIYNTYDNNSLQTMTSAPVTSPALSG